MQKDLLANHPDPELRIYAVWYDMFPTDSRSRWPENLLNDPRVAHFWDDQKILGRWYGQHFDGPDGGSIYWDAFLLYGASSRWEDDGPSEQIVRGDPIIRERSVLEKALREMRAGR